MSSSKLLHSQPSAPLNPEGLRPVYPHEFLPPVGRWAIFGSITMLSIVVGTIVLAAILKYPTTVKASATIRPTGDLRVVQSVATGRVIQIDVKLHQPVQQGQAIAYLDASRLQTQQRQLQMNIQQIQQQLEQVNAQNQAMQTQINAEFRASQRGIATAEGELRLSQRQLQERQTTTQAEASEAQAAVQLAQEELARYQSLANTGAVSKSQISEKKATLEVAQARLQRAQATLNPSAVSVEIASERIALERARSIAALAVLNQEQEALVQQRVKLQNELNHNLQELQQIETELSHTIIRAPITGMIQQLNLRNRDQLVQVGDLIAQIAPDRVPLEIKAYIAPQDIAQVQIGQSVTMKVSGCPYPDYGTLPGQVVAISPDITRLPPSNVNSALPDSINSSSSSHYEVTIQSQLQSLNSNHHLCPLKPGMDGSVDITTRHETVLVFLMRKARLFLGR